MSSSANVSQVELDQANRRNFLTFKKLKFLVLNNFNLDQMLLQGNGISIHFIGQQAL